MYSVVLISSFGKEITWLREITLTERVPGYTMLCLRSKPQIQIPPDIIILVLRRKLCSWACNCTAPFIFGWPVKLFQNGHYKNPLKASSVGGAWERKYEGRSAFFSGYFPIVESKKVAFCWWCILLDIRSWVCRRRNIPWRKCLASLNLLWRPGRLHIESGPYSINTW
jgi:hypothetical protein